MTVVVPSYRRPQRLAECLAGLAESNQQPDEVLVVLRADDRESARIVCEHGDHVELVHVDRPGVVAALLAGADRSTGEVIVFLDDDTVPRPDWLSRIVLHLREPDIGGAGGRDIVTDPDRLPRVTEAGRLTRWGKLIGNHHLVVGPPRDVDVLKGANMAFRREALALPVQLSGQGAQVHYEVAICLWAKRQGWRLVLDPGAEVLHLPGERFDADRRSHPSLWSTHRAAFNLTWGIFSIRPQLALPRLFFGLLIGDRAVPGVSRAVVALLRREHAVWHRLLPSLSGQLCGAALILFGRKVEMRTFARHHEWARNVEPTETLPGSIPDAGH